MRRFGLIGHPLTHSFSQRYFTDKFQKAGISDCVYENFAIENISSLSSLLKKYPDLEGFNVTIPHKEVILPFLYSKSDVVQEISACNCVRVVGNNLFGFNTDVVGFEQTLESFLARRPSAALILGTGGSSKAVAFVLKKLRIPFHFVSRKPSPNQFTYEELTEEIMRTHELIINTTPLGMYPVDQFPPIPFEFVGADHFLLDLIYNPAVTLFLQKGTERGAATKNGYEMLVLQAEESWRIWNQPLDSAQEAIGKS